MSIATYRDAWGIPHLRAGDAGELAYAQGHNAALDRAWQIEVERHRSQGTTAAFLGPGSLDWDRFARRARLDDTARRCFHRLEPATGAWIGGYVAGVNAGLAEGARRAPEFAATGLAPGRWRPWSPLGIWLSTHILFAGFPAKLWREQVARTLGEDAIGIFATDGPGTTGSNGWLVTGERTATGAPLIAGDPHRIIEAPGVYQQIRLSCPEYDVIGLAVPGVPGVAHFGHTGQVAWAITNAMADYQDLYVERLRRHGGRVQAFGPGGWEDTKAHLETIEVAAREGTAGTAGEGTAGEAGDRIEVEVIEVEVIETERGPVLIGGPDQEIAISLRHPPRVYEDIGFDVLPALLRATSVNDVDRAADRWVEPVNVVLAADAEGGLLHRVAGRVPARHPANRLRVVPAWDPAYRWHGTDEPAPRADVQPGDVVVMANERGISAPLGVEFAPPHRAERIAQLLDDGPPDGPEGTGPVWSADDMASVHTDTLLPSGPLLELLGRLDGLGPEAARLRDRLLGWDRRMSAGSTVAREYAAVRASVVRRLAGHPAPAVLADPAWLPDCPETFAPWLALLPRVAYALDTLLTVGPVPADDVPGIVRAAIEEVADTGQAGTAGSGAVPWGEAHRLAPWQALPDAGRRWPGVGGDHDCVLATSSVPGVTDHCVRGPAARYVWDLARRDGSRWVVPLGASGIPGDPHHLDQLPLWRRGELLPVITDWSLLTLESEMEIQTENAMAIGPGPGPGRESVHTRTVEGFGTVHVVPMDPGLDLDLIHGWVTEDRARFWGMLSHSRERVREIYEYLDSLTTHHVYLLHRGDVPVALFQTYDPAADPIGDHYDVQPGDIGVHTLVGPGTGRPEPGFTGALLSVFLEFVLADPSRRRVVAEPDARNDRAIARFLRTGFTLGPRIQLPDKPAQLVFLPRDAPPPPTR